ncbi:hotdog fold thioesterase [Glutamicibacter protophormiae]|uniref:hotdog fold thioesterase n=1 Tax=Glutamicibacter protophormiae TaxID=37930 RepID=UPI003BAEBAA1
MDTGKQAMAPHEHPAFVNDKSARWLGVEVLRADYGDVVIRMRLRDDMLNGYGIAQGGMIVAFADVAFALACNDPHGDGSTVTVASGVDVNFMNPGFSGDAITATGTLVGHAGRSGLFDIEVTRDNEDGSTTHLIHMRGRSRTIPNRR